MSAKRQEEEMTMEEILSSIRKYVIDDNNEAKIKSTYTPEQQEAAFYNEPSYNPSHSSQQPHTGVKQPSPARREEPVNVLDLTKPYQPEPAFAQEPASQYASAASRPTHQSAAAAQSSLLSEESLKASIGSLSKLMQMQQATPTPQGTSKGPADDKTAALESFLGELVRPMIKQWLDNHLPSLVENIVAKEVKNLMTKMSGR